MRDTRAGGVSVLRFLSSEVPRFPKPLRPGSKIRPEKRFSSFGAGQSVQLALWLRTRGIFKELLL